ncbi:hypothetical protein [Bradyrhizobium sp. BWC-3-1]|uniref:hypothetical protein n=1 Tax=Bradyrhizobium sp. BWC-3-1 TaxID=3080012 RepID=UPI00293EEF74|nr:hypothetical protein [Bradyrhizobium sp. BWC-3-1]WOH60933.1 hypothetical protein RX329_12845 [Bradyrhizobium sp. BWC-3-1]
MRELKQFAANADKIERRYHEMDDLDTKTYLKVEATTNREQIVKLIDAARKTATLNERDQTTLAQCEAALLRFDADSNYEDDGKGNLKRSVIGERIALLLGAFPNGAPCDPVVYVRALFEVVGSVDVSLLALDSAVWEIIETKTFVPAINEVLKIVNKQHEKWRERVCAIEELAGASSWELDRIEKLQAEAIARVQQAR